MVQAHGYAEVSWRPLEREYFSTGWDSNFITRAQGTGAWDTFTQPDTNMTRLSWTPDGSNYGAIIHTRNKLSSADDNYRVYSSCMVWHYNVAAGLGSAIGPGCWMEDRGAGLIPNGYGCYAYYNSGPRILVFKAEAGVVTTLQEYTNILIPSRSILTITSSQTNPGDNTHQIQVFFNGGAIAGPITITPGITGTPSATNTNYGLWGIPDTAFNYGTHYTKFWQANAGGAG